MVRSMSRSRSHASKDETYVVRSLDWLSYSKISAVFMVVNALLMDIVVLAGALIKMEPYLSIHNLGIMGYVSVFVSYFIIGFIGSLLLLVIYNLSAYLVGGLSIKVYKK